MIALRSYATGTFQLVTGDLFGVSKATVHNCIRRVSHLANYVEFDDVRGTTRTKHQFHSMAGFPNVIGCIDCRHVKVIAPSRNEHEYVNRKGYHSINEHEYVNRKGYHSINENEYVNRKGYHCINVQLVCDADLRILNCVVK